MTAKRGLVLSILSRKGGSGRSFLAVHLALALRSVTRRPVLLIDLNLPFSGDCLMQLGLGATSSMADAASKIDFLTPAVLEDRVTKHASGVAVLPACTRVELSELVTPDVVRKHLDIAREAWPYIIVDHGSRLNPEDLVVLDQNTLSLLVVEPNVLAINQTRKLVEFLRAIQYPGERIQYAANKCTEDPRLTPQLIQAHVDKTLLGIIPEDRLAVQESLLNGRPLGRNQDEGITRPIHQLAETLVYWLERMGSDRSHGISSKFLRQEQKNEKETPAGEGTDMDFVALKLAVHQRLVREMATQDLVVTSKLLTGGELQELQLRTEAVVSRILDEEAGDQIRDIEMKRRLSRTIVNEAIALGPLESFLADSTVSEIMVNGAEKIYVEREGRLHLAPERFTSEDQLRRIIERIVVQVGRRIDEQSPLVDARLLDGSRVNAVIPPIALDGSKLTIRKFNRRRLNIDDLIKLDSLTSQISLFLQAAILARKNILISGGTGSGKTTLLNILSSYIPGDERIVTIEDAAELQLPQEHVVRLETRPMNIEGRGEISIRDLVRNSLRMRPDRIIIGECRGGETLDMLQAMNTGHDGSLTTTHANTPHGALARLQTLSMMAGVELPARAIREQVASAIHLIIQQSRLPDGSRKIVYVTEVRGLKDDDTIELQDIFRFEQRSVDSDGKVIGSFPPTGKEPMFLDELIRKGIGLNPEIFTRQRM